MPLTTAQIATLKSAVIADPIANGYRTAGDTYALREWCNTETTTIVWKSNVTIRDTGQAFVGSEWAGMTSANHTRLQTIAQYLAAYNPGDADIRAMFDDIWSGAGGAQTRAALAALWKRPATRAEALFATGTGTTAAPSILAFEGLVSQSEANQLLA